MLENFTLCSILLIGGVTMEGGRITPPSKLLFNYENYVRVKKFNSGRKIRVNVKNYQLRKLSNFENYENNTRLELKERHPIKKI